MLFSSSTFIFAFLPIVLFMYFIVKNRNYRNLILLVTSLIFYAWGEPKYILLMLLSILINYVLTLLIDKYQKHSKKWLITAIIFNLFLIVVFKYLNFAIDNLNSAFNINLPFTKIALPIGISFYTFQILSYVIDVYRKKVKVQKNILHLGTYIALFPQLMAGPIVRYETIEEELINRTETIEKFAEGIRRFIFGLAKKVLIANNMAIVADYYLGPDLLANAGTPLIWIGAIAYAFQIYYDFSGYSDMAIGLGKMFGFTFLENFNYPYIATSITDFWRRWHISLSSWFKDYVYIPLGGNRVPKSKWIRNILIVWFLTGLWHGASWNFVIWGLYFAFFLILEKTILKKVLPKIPKWIRFVVTFLVIVVGWIIFRLETFADIITALKQMFIYSPSNLREFLFNKYAIYLGILYFIPAIIGSIPVVKETFLKIFNMNSITQFVGYMTTLVLFIITIAFLLNSTHNPFIYFRF